MPNDLFEKSVGRSDRNFTFQLSEKIKDVDYSPTSKLPHFRKGFFRNLQSDYFTHKKGQFVFVTETMVKAKAKTISMSAEIEVFENKAAEIRS